MKTPLCAREAIPTHTGNAGLSHEFRCSCCNKLLGIRVADRMHLRFARSHEYLTGYPVTATCRGCGTLNEARAPTR